jgi:membrane-associated protease RseP (regulator of RpoE activity)
MDVYVVQPPRRRYWLHALLFLATVVMTMACGARLQDQFVHHLPILSDTDDWRSLFPYAWILEDPRRLLSGLPFAGTLMLILFTHEMGHYYYCVKYKVGATLPFFLPFPTLVGTLGAFIRIKSFIRSRNGLFDIGIAGPIAGFVVAFVAMIVGLLLSQPTPITAEGSELGSPLIFHLFATLMAALGVTHLQVPMPMLELHPVALAAWFGMLATSLNLLPGGQLDGGHIIYALAPHWHKRVSLITALALIPLALFQWLGWLVWVFVIYMTGLRHPQVPPWPYPDQRRRTLALLAAIMLILTFIPAPFHRAGHGAQWVEDSSVIGLIWNGTHQQ